MRELVALGVALASCALAALASCALAPGDVLRARPYVWASAGEVELRSCRWSTESPIEVALAPGASAAEERVLDAALASLTEVGPGVRFQRARGGSLRVRFVDGAITRADGSPGTGRTVADCRLEPPTRLVAAQLEVARHTPPDWRGRTPALADDELAGALLHELAHALGVAGHAARGDELLAAAPEAARRASRRALEGERSRSPALAALYARPTGEVLARRPVEAWRTAELDRLARARPSAGSPAHSSGPGTSPAASSGATPPAGSGASACPTWPRSRATRRGCCSCRTDGFALRGLGLRLLTP